jgi:hypothetical protein
MTGNDPSREHQASCHRIESCQMMPDPVLRSHPEGWAFKLVDSHNPVKKKIMPRLNT